MNRIRFIWLFVYESLFVFLLSSCKEHSKSKIYDSAPGGAVSTFDISGPIGPSSSVGAADATINSGDYFKPKAPPFTWTGSMSQAVLGRLPSNCDDKSAQANIGSVAIAISGECKIVAKEVALKEIADLGGMLAQEGIDLLDVIDHGAGSQNLQVVDVASPKIDLGSVVEQQKANLDKSSNQEEVAIAKSYSVEDGWIGGARNYRVGSDQFSASVTGYFYVRNKKGMALHSSADVAGKAFGVQRSLIFTKLETHALQLRQAASLNLQVQIFGQEAFKEISLNEPDKSLNKTLLSVNHNYPGTLTFAVGPLPFRVSWAFRIKGSVPVNYNLRPTSLSAGIGPNISSSVSLEGGADVKFAKAGVDGVFSIASARMSGNGLVALTKDKDGKLAFCYNGNIKLAVTEVLGGKLTAYAQLGKPEKSLGKLPLGWRGDMNFVNWAGTSHELSILKTEDQCFPADSQSAL